jgi:hypothetical protein
MKTFYIIPKSSESCLPSNIEETIYIDPDKFILRNSEDKSTVLAFPGCIDIEAEVQLLKPLEANLIAYDEFKWLQAPAKVDFDELDCKNVSNNGCGGAGNRCYYCDACNQLEVLNEEKNVKEDDRFNCPEKKGLYTYKDKICVKDWGDLDKDGDGEPDFFTDPLFQDYKNLLDLWSYKGFGTMLVRFMLAHNTSKDQQRSVETEKSVVTASVKSMSDHDFDAFVQRMASEGKDKWRPKELYGTPEQKRTQLRQAYLNNELLSVHKRWLARMLQQNLMACVQVAFDICDSRPTSLHVSDGLSSVCS